MASLIIHGDRGLNEPAIRRRIHIVPVLGRGEAFPSDRLLVDVIYSAVRRIREGDDAAAKGVLIVNLSLGNPRRPFHGQLSPWARLLDRFAYQYGLLFIVSAGNCVDPFLLPAFATHASYEDAATMDRATGTLRALASIVADRRLLSPAETVNGLTIGGCNRDFIRPEQRAAAGVNVDPYGEFRWRTLRVL